MHGLRALIFSVGLFFLCAVGFAQGADSVQFLVTSQALNGTAGAQNLNPTNNTSSNSQQLFGDAKLSKNLSAEIGLTASQRDYSSIVLLEKNGQSQNLGTRFNKTEWAGQIKASWAQAAHLVEVAEKKSLSDSPYSQRSHTFSYTGRGPYDVFKAGATLNETITDQPVSFFVARDYSTQQRPDLLDAYSQSIWLEYALSEEAKIRGTLLHGSRHADRPDHYGEEIKLGYALSPLYSLRFALQNIDEQQTPLLDERGRFNSKSIDAELTWLINYRAALMFGYGLVLEEENNKADGSSEKIGHDIYSFGASYRVASVMLTSNLLYQATSQHTEEFQAQGGVLWEL